MHIALYKPDIPQNTAAIIRLSSCLGLKLHIVEPCGFSLEDSRFKRVVMDYIGLSKIFRYGDYDMFLKKNSKSRIILMTTKAKRSYLKFKFKSSDILLFGRESSGVPKHLHQTIKDKLKIPISKKTRSLNVAITVAIAASEALRQNNC
ncbi:tRNA (cytidine(34)-2'-O)-methyltransferase [Pelagibacterales bacterium SAG-MED29]|nr:tRNA (cytidine(34)-2'-O)-methyltransferase [Pelagibacterales bacterium SAG-MED29]